jgi:beta-lysine 5,6-aminomutase beta subunit
VSQSADTRGASRIVPYADHKDDGLVQVCFTLPLAGRRMVQLAACEVARRMGLSRPELAHQQELCDGYTYCVVYGRFEQPIEIEPLAGEHPLEESLDEGEIDSYVQSTIGRPIVVVGASTGSDTHSVGIDAMLNVKGFDGHHGLESYDAFVTHNLGSQVQNEALLARALRVGADAILVSQTVTQQDLHVQNLTELAEMVEAEGVRNRLILVCGGPRISPELAKELGFDAGFSKGTLPSHLASFLAHAVAARTSEPPLAGGKRA